MKPEKLTLSNKRAFETFVPPGEITEIRILNAYGKTKAWDGFAKGTVAGYFDNHDTFYKAAQEANKAEHGGLYITLQ